MEQKDSSSCSSGGNGRGVRLRQRRAQEAEMADGIGIGIVTAQGDAEMVGDLPRQMEQLTRTQHRDLVSMVAAAGPKHHGSLAIAVGGHAQPLVSSRGFRADKYNLDFIQTISKGTVKQGKQGDVVGLQSNYFALKKECDWCLYTHFVTFSTDIDSVGLRKRLIRDAPEMKDAVFLYDGTTLYSNKELSRTMTGKDNVTNQNITVTITFVNKLIPGDNMYMHFYNVMMRKCLLGLKLEQLGRHFYNPKKGIKFNQHKLELWPGFITAIRNHEKEVLLCVEITHKVVRSDSCLDAIRRLQPAQGDYKQNVTQALVGSIVLTSYNNKTYRVDDVDWSVNPKSTFDKKEVKITFAEYFQQRYQVTIKDLGQPLLMAETRQKDAHAARIKQRVLLIPELCQMTGLTDEMRGNFSLMKTLSDYLHMTPGKRIESIKSFMCDIKSEPSVANELSGWGLEFSSDLTKCQGRILPREGIILGPGVGDNKPAKPNEKAGWGSILKGRHMLKSINLEKWSILVPQRDAQNIYNLVKVMTQVAKPLGFIILPPVDIIKVPDGRSASYLSALDNATKIPVQLVFVILPFYDPQRKLFAAVKTRLTANVGLISQCFLAKNLISKRLESDIVPNLVRQMSAKLGGEPWTVQIPLKKTMIVGFDAYCGGRTRNVEKSGLGAVVSTVNASFSRYFSTTTKHKNLEELGTNLALDVNKCLEAYRRQNNNVLPERVIMYRAGVGDGQLRYVYETEVANMQTSIADYYLRAGAENPKLTYIVVTKRINTRIFNVNNPKENPGPGTVVDNTITLPERYDFYMITAAARQGTVSPCSYNVIYDSGDLDADKIQRLTYKLCHLYYNWSGTVAVPAPCQYAHKLAFLTGMGLGGQLAADALSDKLHFL